MKSYYLLFTLIPLLIQPIYLSKAGNSENDTIYPGAPSAEFRIAFGSCNRVKKSREIWNIIASKDPNMFIWTGDIVYPDPIIPITESSRPNRVKRLYQKMAGIAEYSAFKEKTIITGIYDDHDYGKDNGGAEYKHKEKTRQYILDFLDVSKEDKRRSQSGIYHAQLISHGNLKIKIILLDTRFNRTAPGVNGDILGEEQWQWLENELKENIADFTVIVSSITFLSADRSFEGWGNFPAAKLRMLQLLQKYVTEKYVIISGDKHYAEIMESESDIEGVRIHEILSSGLTHNYANGPAPENHLNCNQYFGKNFGMLQILEQSETIVVRAYIFDDQGNIQLQKKIEIFKAPVT